MCLILSLAILGSHSPFVSSRQAPQSQVKTHFRINCRSSSISLYRFQDSRAPRSTLRLSAWLEYRKHSALSTVFLIFPAFFRSFFPFANIMHVRMDDHAAVMPNVKQY